MANDRDEDEVGFGRPPKDRQFKKGNSPWNKGRRKAKYETFDLRILNDPIEVVIDGKNKLFDLLEAELRSYVRSAQKGNMAAAAAFMLHCKRAGMFPAYTEEDDHQYVIRVPKEWDYAEWLAKYDKLGPPPWPGEHDGLIPADRWEAAYGQLPRPR